MRFLPIITKKILAALAPFLILVFFVASSPVQNVWADPLDDGPLRMNRFGFEREDSFALPRSMRSGNSGRAHSLRYLQSDRESSGFWGSTLSLLSSSTARHSPRDFARFDVRRYGLDDLASLADYLSSRVIQTLADYFGKVFSIDSAFAELSELSSGLGASGLGFGASGIGIPEIEQSGGDSDGADFENSERIARRLYRESSGFDRF